MGGTPRTTDAGPLLSNDFNNLRETDADRRRTDAFEPTHNDFNGLGVTRASLRLPKYSRRKSRENLVILRIKLLLRHDSEDHQCGRIPRL